LEVNEFMRRKNTEFDIRKHRSVIVELQRSLYNFVFNWNLWQPCFPIFGFLSLSVWIRNKTQLAGEKDSLRGGKKHLLSWQVSLKNYSPIPNPTCIWWVGEWLFPPLF
jgi:hypothetical protein